jgi:hypothetical protein
VVVQLMFIETMMIFTLKVLRARTTGPFEPSVSRKFCKRTPRKQHGTRSSSCEAPALTHTPRNELRVNGSRVGERSWKCLLASCPFSKNAQFTKTYKIHIKSNLNPKIMIQILLDFFRPDLQPRSDTTHVTS